MTQALADTPRLALLFDYPEEEWPSMDLCATQLLLHLQAKHTGVLRAERVCPRYRRRATRLPFVGRSGTFANVDRLLNRHVDYPAHAKRIAGSFDAFHVCDHSYAQLSMSLPSGKTGVFCHDLDAFTCLLDPAKEPRPRWFRSMARRILAGLKRAEVVFHPTQEIRRQILDHGLVDPVRLVYAPLGVDPAFFHATADLHSADALINDFTRGRPFILNVGSCIPRKRIDVLLDAFAHLRKHHPDLRLVQVGGTWTPVQQRQIEGRKLLPHLVQLRGLPTATLAAIYHRAAVVVQPTEAEGFGLPLAEALASGAAVVTSDLPVLHEVGGNAAVFVPVGDAEAFAHAVDAELTRHVAPPRETRVMRARRFSWEVHATTIASAYAERIFRTGATKASAAGVAS